MSPISVRIIAARVGLIPGMDNSGECVAQTAERIALSSSRICFCRKSSFCMVMFSSRAAAADRGQFREKDNDEA